MLLQIKRISVKEVTSPIIFDNLKNAVIGGLYDPAFGPMDSREKCGTCGMNNFECPGHFGHVEVSVPLYNPLVFMTLYKLLRSCCMHCFKFRVTEYELEQFCERFELLGRGDLVEAMEVRVKKLTSHGKKEQAGFDLGESDTDVEDAKPRTPPKRDGKECGATLTSQMMEAVIATQRDFFRGMTSGKCPHCNAHSPALKREGHTKLFLMPLPPKKRAANASQGTHIADLLQAHNTQGAIVPREEVHVQGKNDESEEDADTKKVLEKGGIGDHDSKNNEAKDTSKSQHDLDPLVSQPKFLTPTEAREMMKRIWRENCQVLKYIFPSHGKAISNWQDFFIQTIPVAPNRFRPANHVGDQVYEHPQNTILVKILNGNLDLVALSREENANMTQTLRLWLNLQNALNALLDSSTADDTFGITGIRQQLEKKEGLFRKNMMGKRVNFAARSVISPDVFLNGGEIGVPPYFASRLSFPERVTPWNVERLREAVIAGPGRIPGAIAVEDERGRVVLLRKDKKSREAIAKTLYASSHIGAGSISNPAAAQYGGGKIVYRTMTDGDFMLTNRQPTLHKPGMMGHRARIMRAERTIRFHYANCSTFNADFDGDEINLHLPQDHLGRAEGLDIVHADQQFFVPTDGKPLRGLIQDHIVAGTLMTMQDRFLSKSEYCQLIYDAIAQDCNGGWDIWMEPPTIMKPTKLWTGKQVFTAVLMHYTRDQLPLTMAAKCKTPAAATGDAQMHIWRNHLVAGVVDKAMFGKHGLLHIFHELYGADRTSIFTASLSRLFTAFLQRHGFTCGISDVLLLRTAEASRQELLDTADGRALHAAANFVNVKGMESNERVAEELEKRFLSNSTDVGAALDMKMSGAMHPLSSEVVKACLPAGQAKSFRHNMMALMTMTGAKGSVVNFSQISCLLGQQELEGRRVPRMASGKTLPCFSPYDCGARSGGFVGDRFLTGLRPQEYYFHCMAGREGLVDTTVKTSRSGYLQRCLVKNLEPLRVSYDGTVRDDCDGSIVQFLYGEDGQNPTSIGCLRSLPLLYYNMPQFAKQVEATAAKEHGLFDSKECREAYKAIKKRSTHVLKGKAYDDIPLNARFSQDIAGVTSEAFQDAVTFGLFGGYLLPPNTGDVRDKLSAIQKKAAMHISEGHLPMNLDAFHELMQIKYYRSRAEPGEAVGVIAAQSVGEPSTQMTLNTFHMAGRGEANVTLGIPRLREILMTASDSIKTPVMTLPLVPEAGSSGANQMSIRLKQIIFAEAVKGIEVTENIVTHGKAGDLCRGYAIKLSFHSIKDYPEELNVNFEELAHCFTQEFVPKLKKTIKVEMKKLALAGGIELDNKFVDTSSEFAAPKSTRKPGKKDDDDENKEMDEDNEEGKLRFAGGRGEMATYGEGDEEDRQIEQNTRKVAAELVGDVFDDELASGMVDNNGNQEDMLTELGYEIPSDVALNKEAMTCELSDTYPVDAPKIMMRELVERVAATTVMRGLAGISKCYILDASSRGGEHVLQTDGINIPGIWAHSDLIDVNKLTTNSPAHMLMSLGVEAARATIMAEVSSVFGAYGIAVDSRHLTLIADYMTHAGGYRACNRLGIETSTSPLLKMSFETAANFLISATLHGDKDPLTSASSRIVVGQPISAGTGSIDILHDT
jgi:DNA-directed RNA polymerase I subunit RPA1